MTDEKAATEEVPTGPPWENRAEHGLANAFGKTVMESSLRPTEFFRALRPTGNLLDAALFGMGIVAITAFVQLLWSLFVSPIPLLFVGADHLPFAPLYAAAAFSWVRLFVAPIVWIVALLFLAGLFHLSLAILGSARNPFDTTFRTVCYSMAPVLLSLLPFCGDPIGKIWALVLCVIGLRECQGASTGQAILSVLLPAILLLGCCGLLLSFTAVGAFLSQG
jgi:hypothetical protein